MQEIGISGQVKHFEIFVAGDVITVSTERGIEAKRKVEGLGEFIRKAKDLRLG